MLLVWFLGDEPAEKGELSRHTVEQKKGGSVYTCLREGEDLGMRAADVVIVSLCETKFVCGCEKGIFGSESAWA